MKKIVMALVATTMLSTAAHATGSTSFTVNNSDGSSTNVTIGSANPDVMLSATVEEVDENGVASATQMKFFIALDYVSTYVTAASTTATNEALENIAQTLELTLGDDVVANIGLINTKINQMAADKTMWENTAISSQAYYSSLLDQFNALTESVNADYLAITEMETGAPRDHMLRLAGTSGDNTPVWHDATYGSASSSQGYYNFGYVHVTDNVVVNIRRNGSTVFSTTVDTFNAGGGTVVEDSVREALYAAHTDGFNEGWTSGWEYGYDEGYDDGFEAGYDMGYADGWDDAIASVTTILDN